jgi:GGDEF domain-containing protein
MRSMDWDRARGVLLATGVALIGLIALTAFFRDVDRVEVVATLMYAPVLAGMLSFGLSGGLLLGLAAAGVYVGLRLPAIDLVGFTPIAGTVISRVLGYLAFGTLGGWAANQLRVALDRYELIDELDQDSGLGNRTSVIGALARESNRARRYGSPFSVVTTTFDDIGTDRRARARLRELGAKVAMSIRAADHAAHIRTEAGHQIIVVLPETTAEGAETVEQNLGALVAGVVGRQVHTEAITDVGGDEDPLTALRDRLTATR